MLYLLATAFDQKSIGEHLPQQFHGARAGFGVEPGGQIFHDKRQRHLRFVAGAHGLLLL
jgi:hypothetical protein